MLFGMSWTFPTYNVQLEFPLRIAERSAWAMRSFAVATDGLVHLAVVLNSSLQHDMLSVSQAQLQRAKRGHTA